MNKLPKVLLIWGNAPNKEEGAAALAELRTLGEKLSANTSKVIERGACSVEPKG